MRFHVARPKLILKPVQGTGAMELVAIWPAIPHDTPKPYTWRDLWRALKGTA